ASATCSGSASGSASASAMGSGSTSGAASTAEVGSGPGTAEVGSGPGSVGSGAADSAGASAWTQKFQPSGAGPQDGSGCAPGGGGQAGASLGQFGGGLKRYAIWLRLPRSEVPGRVSPLGSRHRLAPYRRALTWSNADAIPAILRAPCTPRRPRSPRYTAAPRRRAVYSSTAAIQILADRRRRRT